MPFAPLSSPIDLPPASEVSESFAATPADVRYMRRALELARHGAGRTSPNPMVGAVIVKNATVLAEGWHHAAGQPHAEVDALRKLAAPGDARGATMYVTLEPCCHTGRTGPCTEALIAAGIARVVVATSDPNPLVDGKGMRRLREAGMEVHLGLLEREAVELNAGFLMLQSQGRPFVMAKWAMTLDGRIAATSGDSQWISNETSLQVVHRMRARSDAIMVGIGTVLRDNPRLNVRLPGYAGRQPLRVVIDTRLRTPLKAAVCQQDPMNAGKTILFCSHGENPGHITRFTELGVEVCPVDSDHGMINMKQVLEELGRRQVLNLLVEGGGQLHGSLMREGLIDAVTTFVAPKLIGSLPGRNPIEGFGHEYMRDALNLTRLSWEVFNGDLCVRGYVRKPNALRGLLDEPTSDDA